MRIFIVVLVSVVLTGCLGMPETVKPVQDFEINRYLGKWYEVARLDHSFERGLEQITADYALREDGGISVINRGYSIEDKQWSVAEGKAYFVDNESEGYLKVSFFGPFYGSYVIFELEQDNYDYAFVSGPDLSYLWLLSRTSNLPQEVIDKFIETSKQHGFDVDKIIFVNHVGSDK
ncbi:MAG: lipocalin family protein [Spongiibacteraceae bacterium]